MTIKSQLQLRDAVPGSSSNTSQVSDSSPDSTADAHESEKPDDDSGTTLPRPRALVYDSEDSDGEGAGHGDDAGDESDFESMRSPSPFLAESDDDALSSKIVRKAREALAKADAFKDRAVDQGDSQSEATETSVVAGKSAWQTAAKGNPDIQGWLGIPGGLQPPNFTPKQASKRGHSEATAEKTSADVPAPNSKRTKTASSRLASTPKLKSSSGCKHNICLGLDKCLVPASPAV